MAFSNKHCLLLVSTVIYMLVFTSNFGQAYDEGEDEGDADHDFPHQGVADTDPALLFDKALECFNDKYIYSSCDEAHRLSQNGELKIGPEYTDEFCSGPCLRETHLVLDCIDGIFKHFVFYNKATLRDVRETIKSGCSYGSKRARRRREIPTSRRRRAFQTGTYLYVILLQIFTDQLDEVDKANTTSQRHRPDVPLKISHSSSSNNRASLRHAPNKKNWNWIAHP